jgi:beta-hydroxylase
MTRETGQQPRIKPKKRLSVALGSRIIKRTEKILIRHSLVSDTPFLAAQDFSWTRPLEANWRTIRAELEEILKTRESLPNFQDISKEQESLTRDDHWKTFFLYGYGYKQPENCCRCPRTTRLVEGVPGMQTAFFSILSPGKHIPSHRGPYRGVLRYHLGLIVPQPETACRIRVGEQFAHWSEGRSLVFDDTYKHEVWNDTDGVRVVLFMDVLRPLRQPAAALNKAVLALIRWSPFIQAARRNQNKWARQADPKA